jgi:glycosyltransferase involved in cell wall biosynthesis
MLETMAMKKPLVLSNIGGLPEVGRNGYNCLLRNANKEEFMQAILELDSNPTFAAEISQNGYDYVTKAFNTKIWDKAILNFFSK